MSRPRLLLLTRPGCTLCDEFREELATAFPGRVELAEACVDDRPDWRQRFGTRIPVLLAPDGEPVLLTRFDPAPLERYLAGG